MRFKVAVVGAGCVGATTAQRIAEKELADIVLIDIVEGISQGKALDMYQSCAIEGFATKINGSTDIEDAAGADIVVIAAGLSRKPGMTREDLARHNAGIVGGIAEQVSKIAPDSMLLIVTNPLDIMTYVAYKRSGFLANRVFGMAGVLDTARYRVFLADELGIGTEDIQTMVLGGHGDEMVPLVEYTTVSGIPVTKLLSQEALERVVTRTRKAGGEIVELLKSGSAYYAPSSAVVDMVEAILKDKKRVLPASALLTGQYGIEDAYMGVPVLLGAGGIEKIIELDLGEQDAAQFAKSAGVIKDNINKLELVKV